MPKTPAAAFAVVALAISLLLGFSVNEVAAFNADPSAEVAPPETTTPAESSTTNEPSELQDRNWTTIALIGIGLGVVLGVTIGRRRNR